MVQLVFIYVNLKSKQFPTESGSPPPRTQSQQQYCRLELAVNLSNNPLQTLKENKVEKSRRVEAVSCVTPNELQGTSGIFSAKNLPFSQGRVAALLLAWPAVK